MTYKEQLADPRWQKNRLRIFERDGWTCQICGDKKMQLEVHHKKYFKFKKPWEYEDDLLITLCHFCHSNISIHIKKYRNQDKFSVLNIDTETNSVKILYSNGDISVVINNIPSVEFCEKATKIFVHFIINNWLKDGKQTNRHDNLEEAEVV